MTVSGQNELSYLGVTAPNPPNLINASRAPTAQDANYKVGTLWVDSVDGSAYILVLVVGQTATWDEIGAGVSTIATINTNAPIGGNYTLAGTAAQIAVAQSAGTSTFSLTGPYTPATYTAHGVLIGEGAAAVQATAAGTTGQVLIGATGANPAFGALGVNSGLTAHGVLLGEGNSAIAATAVGATGTLLAGSTGADPAFTASPSVSGSVTAGTTLTATLGNITATNGNLVLGTAGNKIISTSVATTTVAGANSFGSVTLVGGTATIATSAVTANSLIHIWRQSVGATGAAALGMLSVGVITPATNFTINAWEPADATTLQASDVSVIGWMIVN